MADKELIKHETTIRLGLSRTAFIAAVVVLVVTGHEDVLRTFYEWCRGISVWQLIGLFFAIGVLTA